MSVLANIVKIRTAPILFDRTSVWGRWLYGEVREIVWEEVGCASMAKTAQGEINRRCPCFSAHYE